MSKIFNKSRHSNFASYFESKVDFEAQFGKFSLKTQEIYPPKNKPKSFAYGGTGGVPLSSCAEDGTVSIDPSDAHTLIIGPTGSKKTRLIVMPTVEILCNAGESMIIVDPKAEIYNRVGTKLEKNGYNVLLLNLRMPNRGSSWNPLSIPYKFYCDGNIDKACEFANDIAENLTHQDASKNDPFWDNSAGSLFFGLVILLFKYCNEFNEPTRAVHIGNVINLRNKLFSEMKRSPLWGYIKSDNFITSALSGTMEAPNETRQSILSVFDEKMRTFSMQPNLINLLADNDISFDHITDKKTALFLILPDEKTSYHKLASLFIKQSYEYIIFSTQLNNNHAKSNNKIRLNYIIDEFSSLPIIKDFPSMITAARSRNIRFNIVVQSKHQLKLRYAEETDTIMSNCANWIFLTSRELVFLQEISLLCGDRKADGAIQPVLSVSELQRLDKDRGEALVLSGRMYPIIVTLPDISSYSGNSEKEFVEMPEKNIYDCVILTFNKLKHPTLSAIEDIIPNRAAPKKSDFNVDELVKRIDGKIAELEKEEKTKQTELQTYDSSQATDTLESSSTNLNNDNHSDKKEMK